jgi:3-methyl-2-oxobutanoate hydroxymethyltransferase
MLVCVRGIIGHRGMASIQPESVVYSGPSSPTPRRVTLRTLRNKYQQGTPISMSTAYDYPSAVHVSVRASVTLMISYS